MVVPIKLKLGSAKTHASKKPGSPEAKNAEAEAKVSKEALQKAEKPDSFVTSHQAFMGGNKSSFETDPVTGRIKNFKKDSETGSRFKEDLDESPIPPAAEKSVKEPAKIKRSSWFKSRKDSSADDSAPISSSSLMESRRSSSWFSRSGKDSDSDSIASSSSSYSRSSSDTSSIKSTRSERSWSSWRSNKDSDSASVTTVGSQDSRSVFGIRNYIKRRRSEPALATKPYEPVQQGKPLNAAEHRYMEKFYNERYESSFAKGDYKAAQEAYSMKTHHQTEALLAPDAKFKQGEQTPDLRDFMHQTTAVKTQPYGKSEGSSTKDTVVTPEPKILNTAGSKDEKPVTTDMNQLGSLMPHESWAPPTNLYENAGWSKSSASLKSNETHGTPFSKDDSDTKTLYEEPLPVANGFQHTNTPNFRDEPVQFTHDSRRNSTFSTAPTLRDEPTGYSGDKSQDPFVSNTSKDSKQYSDYGQSQKQAPTAWSRSEEQEWDKLSDKYFHGNLTSKEQIRLEELNARAPQGNPNEVF